MNVVGLITEYNPFHNGHLYHFQEAKKLAKADYVVSVMSGNFLQRGEPAIVNKWARAKMAVMAGVDLVIEIPTAFATRSAPSFAFGSVKLLHDMGIVTHVCFGSEEGNIDTLKLIAEILSKEPPELSSLIKKHLAKGVIYPLAQNNALKEFLQQKFKDVHQHLYSIATSPNNILGIEYLKSLIALKSSITPITLKRLNNDYHDKELPSQHNIASATSIRRYLLEKGQTHGMDTLEFMPSTSYDILLEEFGAGRGPIFPQDLEQLILYSLRLNHKSLKDIVDVSEGLENRIIKELRRSTELSDLLGAVKTKRYTWTRLQRILVHHLLNFTQAEADVFQKAGPAYLRILAFNQKGRRLLSAMKEKTEIPLITRIAPFAKGQGLLPAMLDLDIAATDLYTLLYPEKKERVTGVDFLTTPVTQ